MKFLGIATICALVAVLLEGLGFRSKKLFVSLGIIVIMIGAAGALSEVFEPVLSIAHKAGVEEITDKALRAVGLGYVFGFTAEICTSLGEGALANLVTIIGRVEIFLLALPYFLKTVELGMELLS